MAHPSWIQKSLTFKTEVTSVFDTLEKFLDFCKMYGYTYNPAEINNNKAHSWQQYQRFVAGMPFKNHWDDAIRNAPFVKPN